MFELYICVFNKIRKYIILNIYYSSNRKMPLICVDGLIGAGKTTVLDELERRGHVVVREDIKEWQPYLELFYTEPHRWSFTLQVEALQSLSNALIGKSSDKPIFFERGPHSCRVFSANSYEFGYMTKIEYELFERIYETINPWKPDVRIWLNVPIDECLRRVKVRGRPAEDGAIGTEYLKKLDDCYSRMITAQTQPIDGTLPVKRVADMIEEIVANYTTN